MRRTQIPALAASLAIALAACAPVNQDLAQSALARGELDDAVYDVQAALASDPDNPGLKNLAAQIFTQRGVRNYQAGQMLQASDDFHAAVNYYPTYSRAYDYLGMIAFQQHNWDDAINYGSKVAGLDGKPEPGYVGMARQEQSNVRAGRYGRNVAPASGPKPGGTLTY